MNTGKATVYSVFSAKKGVNSCFPLITENPRTNDNELILGAATHQLFHESFKKMKENRTENKIP